VLENTTATNTSRGRDGAGTGRHRRAPFGSASEARVAFLPPLGPGVAAAAAAEAPPRVSTAMSTPEVPEEAMRPPRKSQYCRPHMRDR
jgi:hypothetical protein